MFLCAVKYAVEAQQDRMAVYGELMEQAINISVGF